MREEENKQGLKTGACVLWNLLGFLCAFFACGLVSGLETVFCALAACFAAGLYLCGMGPLSFLSVTAGALSGYAFGLWDSRGGIVETVIEHPILDNSITFSMDLRIQGLLWVLGIALMVGATVICVKKRYARTVCVAVNTGILVAAQCLGLILMFRRKYGAFDISLLQEKLALLCSYVRELLIEAVNATGSKLNPEGLEYVGVLAESLVFSLPLYLLLLCAAAAFFLSFLLKRFLKKGGVLKEGEEYLFMPSAVSAGMYLLISVVCFLWGIFDSESPQLYGLSLLGNFLSYAFLVPGMTAVRLLFSRRKEMGLGSGKVPVIPLLVLVVLFPASLSLLLSILPLAGLAMVLSAAIRKRLADKQNPK